MVCTVSLSLALLWPLPTKLDDSGTVWNAYGMCVQVRNVIYDGSRGLKDKGPSSARGGEMPNRETESRNRRVIAAPASKRKAYELHRLKVTRATCAVDVDPPKDRPHLLLNAKGLQLERERQARIARENFILLKKLADVMHRKRFSKQNIQRLEWKVESSWIEKRSKPKRKRKEVEEIEEEQDMKEEKEKEKVEEEEGEGEEEGEEEYSDRDDDATSSSTNGDDTTRPLTQSQAGDCLESFGKCDFGGGYAYLGLNASNLNLTDVSVIPTFRRLVYVNVSGNKLTSNAYCILSSMTYLLMLRADRNRLDSGQLKPMAYLQVLTLCRNKITDTHGISHELLEWLQLNHNTVREVSFDPCPPNNLRILELRGNILATTNGIFLPNLVSLYLAENQIDELRGLKFLTNLEILHLRSNKLVTLDGFDSRCERLRYLNLRNNEISTISEIGKLYCLPALKTLIVLENPVLHRREKDDATEAETETEMEMETEAEDTETVTEYRIHILAMLPNLERIDKDPVTYKERKEANDFQTQLSAGMRN